MSIDPSVRYDPRDSNPAGDSISGKDAMVAVKAGKTVYWRTTDYQLVYNRDHGTWTIKYIGSEEREPYLGPRALGERGFFMSERHGNPAPAAGEEAAPQCSCGRSMEPSGLEGSATWSCSCGSRRDNPVAPVDVDELEEVRSVLDRPEARKRPALRDGDVSPGLRPRRK